MVYPKAVLVSRLKWLMLARLVLAVVFILIILFIELSGGRLDPSFGVFGERYRPTYWILTGVCALNLVYLILVKKQSTLNRLAGFQVAVDILIVSALVYFTGIDRIFAFLYFAVILSSALLIRPAYGFVFASLATVMLSTVSVLHMLAGQAELQIVLPLVMPEVVREHSQRVQLLVPYLLSFAISLHLAAFLCSKLARDLGKIRLLNEEVLQTVEAGVFAVDPAGAISFLNKEARKLLALPPGPVEGRPYREALEHPQVIELISTSLDQRRRCVREVAIQGTPVEIIASAIHDETSGEPRGVVAILNDLTLRKQVEQMSILEDRFRAHLELSASMAHEIRNPLASIKGASQELGSLKGLPEDDARLLQLLEAEVDRLDGILSSFLEYASLKPMEFKVCDLSAILRDVALLLESRSRDRRVRIVQSIPSGVFWKVDEDKIRQAVLNIGINATEAVPPEGTVTLRCSMDGGARVAIEIEDNGSGIPKEDLTRVFDPFFTTKQRGTGMGLSIAKKFVQAHNGTVAIESEPGRGTRVRLVLPA